MKRFLVLFFLFPALTLAQDHPPLIAAKSYLVTDFGSNQVLLASRIHERVEPASLTKLMTAYLAFSALKEKRLKPEQTIPVSELAQNAIGSRMFVQQGRAVTVDELVHGLVIQAGNDAAIALAEAVGGSEEKFVAMMNREAALLGMKETHFMNATGFPQSNHYTSTFDLSLLASAIIRDFPEYYPLFAIKEYKYNNIVQQNRNRLLWLDPNVDGLQSGHSESSGYCLVAAEKRGPKRLVSVLTGAESDSLRATESLKMLNYSLEAYDTVKLFARDQAVTELRLWMGKSDMLKAGFTSDFFLSVPKGRSSDLKATVAAQQPLVVPISRGQKVGSVKFTLDGKVLGEFPLLALEDVQRANVFKRAWDSIKLLFN